MKTKVLYVLVSTDNDFFAEQTYLSILSLRNHNQEVSVSLLMDNKSSSSIKGRKLNLLTLVDETIVIDLPDDMTNKYKSRVLKTNMRNYVSGDMLYIDSDTIILSDLSSIDSEDSNIAAVYEYNRPFNDNTNKRTLNEILKRVGEDIDNITEYFNSGVIFIKDNDFTHNFFEKWYNLWEHYTSSGVFYDQPSLGILNSQEGNVIASLDGSWNCQGRYSVNYANNAKIYHYLFDEGFGFPLLNKNAFSTLKNDGTVTNEILDVLGNPYGGISINNIIITDDELLLHRSRLYSFISLIQKRPKLFSLIEKFLEGMYSMFLGLKRRTLAPPR